ncbi:gluconokinase [Salipiger sp. IMCC34102]|nr:gluconokinase [Salipiger sp. IMCC34102]
MAHDTTDGGTKDQPPAHRIVAMGVSGCGKSRIGAMLADRLGLAFQDGDDLHPQHNIDKMAAGIPLDDADRAPWLDAVGHALAGDRKVIACSALKRSYRDRIRALAGPVVFVHLAGDREVLLDRVSHRPGHFMPATLLDSQFATLEPPGPDEDAVTVDIDQPPQQVVAAIMATGRFDAR